MSRISEMAQALKGDGCTRAPDLAYRECCDEHDIAYRTGCDVDGNPVTRAGADKRLRQCMAGAGYTFLGRWFLPWMYWGAVRLFGRGHYYARKMDADAGPG